MFPALLEEISNPESFLVDSDYCAEEKLNGRRLLLVKRGGVVRAYSRNGVEYVAPLSVIDAMRRCSGDAIIDGELVGGQLTAFDLPEHPGDNEERRAHLGLLGLFPLVRRAVDGLEKWELMDIIRAEGGEGVVFKRLDGRYDPGQRTYGFKFKFYKTATVRVESVDISKSSMAISIDGKSVGRVCFPFNSKWPKVGELWEVRFDEVSGSGKLMRPQLMMRRDDLEQVLT